MWARLGNMNNKGNRDKCVEPPPEGGAVLGFPNFPYLRFSSLTTQKNVLSNKKEEIRQTVGKMKTRTSGDIPCLYPGHLERTSGIIGKFNQKDI